MSDPIDMFPAHAGMNRIFAMGVALVRNVPRTRGDEPSYDGP